MTGASRSAQPRMHRWSAPTRRRTALPPACCQEERRSEQTGPELSGDGHGRHQGGRGGAFLRLGMLRDHLKVYHR